MHFELLVHIVQQHPAAPLAMPGILRSSAILSLPHWVPQTFPILANLYRVTTVVVGRLLFHMYKIQPVGGPLLQLPSC